MKKYVKKAVALLLCALTVALTLASCAKEPYPYDLEGYISVPEDLKSIDVTNEEIDAAVIEQIASVLRNSATEQTVMNRGAAVGDVVNLSVVCYFLDTYTEDRVTGNVIKPLTDPKCTFKIGDGKYPSELENAMLGKVTGDSFTVHAKLPASYTVDGLAESAVVYECTVNSVKEYVLPVYDDAFVQTVSDCVTVVEYEEMLRKAVIEEIAFDKLLARCSFKTYPVDEVGKHTSNFISYYTDLATAEELTLEEYVAKKFFIELSEFHLKADAYAKELVKSELLMYSLVRSYGLEITEDEYTAGAQKYANRYGLESISALESKFGTDYVEYTVQMDKVLSFLVTKITVPEDGVTE